MTKMVPTAAIAFILAFTLAAGTAMAEPRGLANRGHGGLANHGTGLPGQQDDGPLAAAKQGGLATKLGNRTNGGGNSFSGGTATGTYAGGNAATISGNTVSGNTAGSNNTVNVTGNQASANGYARPYAAPLVVVPPAGQTNAAAPAAATSASCPSGTSMQSITTTAQGQTTVVCVASK